MKKINRCLLTSLALISSFSLLLSSCSKTADNSVSSSDSVPTSVSSASVTSPSVTSASASTSTEVDYVSLFDAFLDTETYSLQSGNFVFEYVDDSLYYYAPNSGGIIILDDDADYVHEFGISAIDKGDSKNHYIMDMHGRVNKASFLSTYATKYCLKTLLYSYLNDFVLREDSKNVYTCETYALSTALSSYFQLKSLTYCTSFDLTVNDEGRLSLLQGFENKDKSRIETFSIAFNEADKSTFEAYTNWQAAGSKITYRITDYKNGIQTGGKLQFFYEGTEADISGIVVAVDKDNSLYVSVLDETTGPIGIRVDLTDKASLPAVGTAVTVHGTIEVKGYEAYLGQASLVTTGEKVSYLPSFDEEQISANYGDGAYLAQLFASYPNYSDSLYSFCTYISDFNDSDATMATATMTFPKFKSSSTYLKAELRIPKSLTAYDSLKTVLSSAVSYGSTNPTLISIEAGIVQFGVVGSAYNNVSVLLTEGSHVANALTPLEKCRQVLGMDTFALPVYTGKTQPVETCFHFGPSRNYGIETVFGIDAIKTEGICYSVSISETDMATYQTALVETMGFTLANKIKDTSSHVHAIYVKGKAILDLSTYTGVVSGYTMNLYLYQADTFVHGTFFKERLSKIVPDGFSVDDYVMPAGTYDADYNVFQLTSYAGNDYSQPLTVTTWDMQGNESESSAALTALIDAYKAEGYTQAHDDSGAIIKYRTRAFTHRIYEKNGIYVDFSLYSTDDYTFLGSADFTYRIEVAIYKKSDYKGVHYEKDMSGFNALLTSTYNAEAAVDFSLPSDVSIELYKGTKNGELINYGYGFSTNCFLYGTSEGSKVSDILAAVESSLVDSGYSLSYTTTKGNKTYIKTNSEGKVCTVFVLINTTGNYVRLIIGMGGARF